MVSCLESFYKRARLTPVTLLFRSLCVSVTCLTMCETDIVSNILEIDKPSKMDSKDKHLQKYCPMCLKTMRSDNLKRHLKTHTVTKSKVLMTSCDICEKAMRKNTLKDI